MNLEEHTIASKNGSYSRKVWLHAAPTDDTHPVCIVLDAEYYLRDMEIAPITQQLMDENAIQEMTFVFISHVSAEDRHIDYQYNDEYRDFIVNDVVDWTKEKVPSIQNENHVICGLSLSGLMSVYIAAHHPALFPRCLAQSGSFWLKHEWFEEKLKSLGKLKTKFYMSVGDEETEENVTHQPNDLYQEISQVAGVKKAASVLEDLGAEVNFQIYKGGHAITPWKKEFPDAMKWLCFEKNN